MHVAFWGETDMIISKLEIKRLYGMYDYCLSFFDDLTLLYGENGCGKTTVLDIVTSIVTGRIYNLTAYQFEQIKLYYKENKRSKTFQISIISDDLSYEIDIDTSSGKIHESISDINSLTEEYDRDRDESAFERKYYSQYRISDYLRKAFNYIYLPLSRESQEGFENSDLSYYRRISRRYSERDILNKSYLNTSLRFVEEMIRSSRMRINAGENRINARFRSSIFTSSLKVVDYNTTNISNLLKRTRDKNVLRSIENSKAEYIRTLKSIGEWNEDMEVQVSAFFEKYVEAFRKVQNQEGEKGTNTITVDFLLMDMEFNRIKEIAAQAQQIETEKKTLNEPIDSFLAIVNGFFSIGDDKKSIMIDSEGRIIIQSEIPNRTLSIYNLSSGEKQIIIIFARLIFGLNSHEHGIYIIDEPEASLHLAWQKRFVESVQKVDNTIQLIFATHSPEIIGKNSNRMVKLTRKINLPIDNQQEGEK